MLGEHEERSALSCPVPACPETSKDPGDRHPQARASPGHSRPPAWRREDRVVEKVNVPGLDSSPFLDSAYVLSIGDAFRAVGRTRI